MPRAAPRECRGPRRGARAASSARARCRRGTGAARRRSRPGAPRAGRWRRPAAPARPTGETFTRASKRPLAICSAAAVICPIVRVSPRDERDPEQDRQQPRSPTRRNIHGRTSKKRPWPEIESETTSSEAIEGRRLAGVEERQPLAEPVARRIGRLAPGRSAGRSPTGRPPPDRAGAAGAAHGRRRPAEGSRRGRPPQVGRDLERELRRRARELRALVAEQQEVDVVARRVGRGARRHARSAGTPRRSSASRAVTKSIRLPANSGDSGGSRNCSLRNADEHRADQREVEERPEEDPGEERGAQPHGRQSSAFRISM